ncbi:hypothetical protein J4558_08670 [Leptolyngbya sp. 15MV]|nr:hypothetical protein J4558_08670 [Leptolyngbya sp. 15MV]
MRTGIVIIISALAAAPANALVGVQIAEPSNMALFALGVGGVIVGRIAARRRRGERED